MNPVATLLKIKPDVSCKLRFLGLAVEGLTWGPVYGLYRTNKLSQTRLVTRTKTRQRWSRCFDVSSNSRPCSTNGHCTPPLIMNHKFVLRGTKLDMISIIWLFILLIIELQIMATNRNILLYLICNWKTERPDSILDLRYKPRDTIKINWIWTAVLLASFWAFSVSYVWPPPYVSNLSLAESKAMQAKTGHCIQAALWSIVYVL